MLNIRIISNKNLSFKKKLTRNRLSSKMLNNNSKFFSSNTPTEITANWFLNKKLIIELYGKEIYAWKKINLLSEEEKKVSSKDVALERDVEDLSSGVFYQFIRIDHKPFEEYVFADGAQLVDTVRIPRKALFIVVPRKIMYTLNEYLDTLRAENLIEAQKHADDLEKNKAAWRFIEVAALDYYAQTNVNDFEKLDTSKIHQTLRQQALVKHRRVGGWVAYTEAHCIYASQNARSELLLMNGMSVLKPFLPGETPNPKGYDFDLKLKNWFIRYCWNNGAKQKKMRQQLMTFEERVKDNIKNETWQTCYFSRAETKLKQKQNSNSYPYKDVETPRPACWRLFFKRRYHSTSRLADSRKSNPKYSVVNITENGTKKFKILKIIRGHYRWRITPNLVVFYQTDKLKKHRVVNIQIYKKQLKKFEQKLDTVFSDSTLSQDEIKKNNQICVKYQIPALFITEKGKRNYVKIRELIQPEFKQAVLQIQSCQKIYSLRLTALEKEKNRLNKLRKLCILTHAITKLDKIRYEIQFLGLNLVAASSITSSKGVEIEKLRWRDEIISCLIRAFAQYKVLVYKDIKKLRVKNKKLKVINSNVFLQESILSKTPGIEASLVKKYYFKKLTNETKKMRRRFLLLKRKRDKKSPRRKVKKSVYTWNKWGSERRSFLKLKKGKARRKALENDKQELRPSKLASALFAKNFRRKPELLLKIIGEANSKYSIIKKKHKNKLITQLSRLIPVRKQVKPLFPAALQEKTEISFLPAAWWKKKQINNRTLNKLIYSEVTSGLPSQTSSFKNEKTQNLFLLCFNYFSLTYKLLYRRWHYKRTKEGSPIPRLWPSKIELLRREKINEQRMFRREAIKDKISKEKNLKNYTAVQKLEKELRKKENEPLRVVDKAFQELENLIGYPASLGYTRIRRRILQGRIDCTAVPSPVVHAFTLLKYKPKKLAESSQTRMFYSKYKQRPFFTGLTYKMGFSKRNNKNLVLEATGYRTASYDRAFRTFYKKMPGEFLNGKNLVYRAHPKFLKPKAKTFKMLKKCKLLLSIKRRRLTTNKLIFSTVLRSLDNDKKSFNTSDKIKVNLKSSFIQSKDARINSDRNPITSFSVRILQMALNKRQNTRCFLDFILRLKKRMTPSEQTPPPWILKKTERSLSKKSILTFNKTNQFSREESVLWGQSKFAVYVLNRNKAFLKPFENGKVKKLFERMPGYRKGYSIKRGGNITLFKNMFHIKKFRMWPEPRDLNIIRPIKNKKLPIIETTVVKKSIIFNKKYLKPQIAVEKTEKNELGRSKIREKQLFIVTESFLLLFKNIIKKKILDLRKKNNVTKTSALYWSIRMYLSITLNNDKQNKGVLSPTKKSAIETEMSVFREDTVFDKNFIKKIRYNFQPTRYLPKSAPLAATIQWLRIFFPKKHTLYTENPEEHKILLLSPAEIFRTNLSDKNPGLWNTKKLGTDSYAKLKFLVSKTQKEEETPRFETVLTTVKRKVPSIKKNYVMLSSAQKNFYKMFSTNGSFVIKSLKITKKRLKAQLAGRYYGNLKRTVKESGAEATANSAKDSLVLLKRKKSIRGASYNLRTVGTNKSFYKKIIAVFSALYYKNQRSKRVTINVGLTNTAVYSARKQIGQFSVKKHVRSLNNEKWKRPLYNGRAKQIIFSKSLNVLKSSESSKALKKIITINYKKTNLSDSVMAVIIGKQLRKKKLKESTNVFLIRRNEVWYNLTSRWTKKDRTLRYWLKVAKRTFKRTGWVGMSEKEFKETRNRLKTLNWAEDDGIFDRPDLKTAFQMSETEKSRNPWLEPLIYKRALYATNVGPYRKSAIPREQKRLKRLQHFRKQMLNARQKYLRGRRLFKLNILNTKLYLSLFHIVNKKAARNRFKNLNKNRKNETGFSKNLTKLAEQYNVLLILFGIAPNTFWSNSLAKLRLLRVNGTCVEKTARIQVGDILNYNYNSISYVTAILFRIVKKYEIKKKFILNVPANYFYCPTSKTATCVRSLRETDMKKNDRIGSFSFSLFRSSLRLGR